MKEMRVLPADVYDALEFSALAFGGIGGDNYEDATGNPLCAQGHASVCGGDAPWVWNAVTNAVATAHISPEDNDNAVAAINARLGRGPYAKYARVSFAEWCAELGVVRG